MELMKHTRQRKGYKGLSWTLEEDKTVIGVTSHPTSDLWHMLQGTDSQATPTYPGASARL